MVNIKKITYFILNTEKIRTKKEKKYDKLIEKYFFFFQMKKFDHYISLRTDKTTRDVSIWFRKLLSVNALNTLKLMRKNKFMKNQKYSTNYCFYQK